MSSVPSDPMLPEPKEGIDFESLPWNLNRPGDHNFIMIKTTTGSWDSEHYDSSTDTGLLISSSVHSYSEENLGLNPAATSLNYGTTIWEGLKCFRSTTGRAVVFRPDRNYKRFADGCAAMCLPVPSYELFMRGVQAAVQCNGELVPPQGEGTKLYVRPMMIGSGQQLGLYPSKEFTLLFYVSPTGNYFKGKAVGGLKLHLETKYCRAALGGTGNVKCAGNYAVALRPLMEAKKENFDDNLYVELDTLRSTGNIENAVLQELSAANFFVVLETGEVVTPSLSRGTILPGVTRATVLELVELYSEELLPEFQKSFVGTSVKNLKAVERDLTVADLAKAAEAFVTGTAAEIVPVQSIATSSASNYTYKREFPYGATLPGGPVTAKILQILREVMTENRPLTPTTSKWIPDPFKSPESFRNLES